MAEQREVGNGREGATYYRHDEAFWRELLTQWHNSGLSIRAFCRQQGLAVSTYGLWRKRMEREQPVAVPLTVTAETAFIDCGGHGCGACRARGDRRGAVEGA
ncbi:MULTISPECIES: IS66 family insertion sequence element accessory protein TnpA [Cupriavidus]|uniref:IS66 family insertion sequence element accessory protein TnpA n=1 Tax=Cupriavidus TaxID=106589 RepID=UPI0015E4706C|nr:hypothetical protein [Cupriavidus pinatubonensis]